MHKYLKYKLKYINLKNNLLGGAQSADDSKRDYDEETVRKAARVIKKAVQNYLDQHNDPEEKQHPNGFLFVRDHNDDNVIDPNLSQAMELLSYVGIEGNDIKDIIPALERSGLLMEPSDDDTSDDDDVRPPAEEPTFILPRKYNTIDEYFNILITLFDQKNFNKFKQVFIKPNIPFDMKIKSSILDAISLLKTIFSNDEFKDNIGKEKIEVIRNRAIAKLNGIISKLNPLLTRFAGTLSNFYDEDDDFKANLIFTLPKVSTETYKNYLSSPLSDDEKKQHKLKIITLLPKKINSDRSTDKLYNPNVEFSGTPIANKLKIGNNLYFGMADSRYLLSWVESIQKNIVIKVSTDPLALIKCADSKGHRPPSFSFFDNTQGIDIDIIYIIRKHLNKLHFKFFSDPSTLKSQNISAIRPTNRVRRGDYDNFMQIGNILGDIFSTNIPDGYLICHDCHASTFNPMLTSLVYTPIDSTVTDQFVTCSANLHKICRLCRLSRITHTLDDKCNTDFTAQRKEYGSTVVFCPKCKIPGTKDRYCNHITCITPNCNTHYCYLCREILTQPYLAHYTKEDHQCFTQLYGIRCPTCNRICNKSERTRNHSDNLMVCKDCNTRFCYNCVGLLADDPTHYIEKGRNCYRRRHDAIVH